MKKKLALTKDRPNTSIYMIMPLDLVDKLKKIAQLKEMSGYQSLIKYYIGQGLLRDADLVCRVEAEEAQLEAERLEVAFRKIGMDSDTMEAFWKEWGVRTANKGAAGDDAGESHA